MKTTENITKREREILLLLSFGFTRRQIADKIFLSKNTVTTYMKSLSKKLAVANKAHAVLRGFELGILNVNQNFENYN